MGERMKYIDCIAAGIITLCNFAVIGLIVLVVGSQLWQANHWTALILIPIAAAAWIVFRESKMKDQKEKE